MNLLPMLAATALVTATRVSDVFSANTYTGNGSTVSVTNGLDLSTKGGAVWLKPRSGTYGGIGYSINDTTRGVGYRVASNSDAAEAGGAVSAFNSNGFSVGANAYNQSGEPSNCYYSLSFRKAKRFFDIQTWTGNATNRTISHALEQDPGMILVKRLDDVGDWQVYHRSLANTEYMVLNTTAAKATGATLWNSTTATSAVFSIGTGANVNTTSALYIAYIFSHDTSGLIQCGTFTTDGSGAATVNHGWSAGVQFAMFKASDTTGDWEMFDTARTSGWSGSDARLRANLVNAEDAVTRLSASGTSLVFAGLSASKVYIYCFVVAP